MIETYSERMRERYFCIHHPSGMEICVYPKQMSTLYAEVTVKYGSVDRTFRTPDGKRKTFPAGIAHFLEHKMFDNPDGRDAFARFSELGADANAYTSTDRTVYLFNTTSEAIPALRELLSMVALPYFTRESVQKELGIIAEEIRMREDKPGSTCFRNLLCAMYRHHPLREQICGTAASISRISPEMLYEAHRWFYQPSNLILTVCGDITPEAVVAVTDECLGTVPSSVGTARQIVYRDTPNVFRTRIECRMQTGVTQFALGIKDPHFGSGIHRDARAEYRRGYACTLLDDLLFSPSESLYESLFEAGKISPAWSYGYMYGRDYGYHAIGGESECPEEVAERVHRHVEDTLKNGFSEESLLICRRVAEAEYLRNFNSTESIAEEAADCMMDGIGMFETPDVIAGITEEELYGLLEEMRDEERYALSVVRPLEEKE